MVKTLIIDVLGGFRAEVDGRPVPDSAWRHRRGADLVKILALSPNHRIHREQLMDILWPGLGPEAAAANLRKAVHFARRALRGEETIGTDGAMVTLLPRGRVTVDVEEFSAAAGDALAGDAGALDAAIKRYGGELLPEDRYAEWAETHRERARTKYLALLREAGLWEQILEADRADEEAHRALMQRYLRDGNRQAALRQFEQLRRILRADLGVGPEAETIALYEKALATQSDEPPDTAGRVHALISWGLVHWNRRDLDEAARVAGQARALAIDASLGRELGEASALLGMVAFARGDWQSLFRDEFMESVTRAPEMVSSVFDAHLCLADFSLYGGGWHDSIPPFAQGLYRVAEEHNSIGGQALTTLLLGEVELLAGRLPRAEELLTHSAGLHQRAGTGSGRTLAIQRLAEVWMARNKKRKAARLLAEARPLAEACDLSAHMLVRVLGSMVALEDDPDEKMRVLQEADKTLAQIPVCEPCSIGYRVASAVACAQSGDLARARRCVDEAERVAGMWQGGPWTAATWEARAALRTAEGQPDQAAALLKEAANLFETSGRPLDATRCRAAASA